MPTAIITTDDLREFKIELLGEIKELLHENQAKVIKKEWLKSTQVMNMLNISSGTLRHFILYKNRRAYILRCGANTKNSNG